MRSRNIKPGFWKNEELADLSAHARLLFIGLWQAADRDGRLEDRPKRIKAEIFPYESVRVNELLDKLARMKFIRRYGDEENHFIDIPTFLHHQNPHKNEKSLNLPAYEDFAPKSEDSGTNPADSLLRNEESFIPHSRQTASDGFDTFWKTYPRKEGKGAARKAWASAVKKKPGKEIVASLETHLPHLLSLEQRYRPMPSTWLNQERWDDEIALSKEQAEDDARRIRNAVDWIKMGNETQAREYANTPELWQRALDRLEEDYEAV